MDPNVYLLRERQRRKRRLEEDFDDDVVDVINGGEARSPDRTEEDGPMPPKRTARHGRRSEDGESDFHEEDGRLILKQEERSSFSDDDDQNSDSKEDRQESFSQIDFEDYTEEDWEKNNDKGNAIPQSPWNIEELNIEQKIHALNSIEHAKAVFEKGTWENKLLGSILFAYGKELALKCPHAEEGLEHLKDAQKPIAEEGLRHLRNVRKYLNRNADHYLKNDHF